jgi:uncharacterized protein (TIGR02449 family)
MNPVLDSLEARVDQILAAYSSLRAENDSLRSRIATLDTEKQALENKIEIAASRLETLMESLPAE